MTVHRYNKDLDWEFASLIKKILLIYKKSIEEVVGVKQEKRVCNKVKLGYCKYFFIKY